eukprot:264153_1
MATTLWQTGQQINQQINQIIQKLRFEPSKIFAKIHEKLLFEFLNNTLNSMNSETSTKQQAQRNYQTSNDRFGRINDSYSIVNLTVHLKNTLYRFVQMTPLPILNTFTSLMP